MRELIWMGEAHAKELWNHTASILCLLANLHRDPKKHRAFKPEDFSPFKNRKQPVIHDSATGFRVMKHLFVDKGR